MFDQKRMIGVALFFSIFYTASCGLIQQYQQAMTFAKCEFRLVSVDQPVLASVPLRGMTKASEIRLMDLARIQALFFKGSLPLDFTVQLEVKNPNPSPAAMDKLAWILYLDDNELTSGLVRERLEVPGQGGVSSLPLNISLDLAKLLSGKALDSMISLALNVAGEGTRPTRVSLKIKPSMMVGGQELEYPGYVTVKGEFTSETGRELRKDVLERLDQSLKTK